jgi:two-component system OmpR family sensor kinase
MDGLERKLKGSLQGQLSLWLSLTILLVAICGGVLSFKAVYSEADEFQDDQLRQVAGLLEHQDLPADTVIVQNVEKSRDSESQIFVQVLDATPVEIQAKHHERILLPVDIPEGLQTFQATKFKWRLFVRLLPSGNRLVVGQRLDVRDDIARDGAIGTLLPSIVLIPLLIILINFLIHRMLKPVNRLASELDSRHESDLRRLDDTQVPREIRPFTTSINQLLHRVEKSVDMQRRFVADAAHELRSPLTALSLQADNLATVSLPPDGVSRLASLQRGLARSRLLLEQLLSLARSQAGASLPAADVPVQELFRRTLEDMIPIIETRKLEIEVDMQDGACFHGHEIDGVTLLKNLIGNAVHYTPPGGKILCRARQDNDALTIEIEDGGPGIPEADRERVFDPFYRVVGSTEIGSGLGLAIVRAIMDRMHARILLENMREQGTVKGLRVTMIFGGNGQG